MKKEIIIDCREDNKFEQDRIILHSCNRTFILEEENIFYAEALGYGDEIIGEYYTICPYCGYLVLLNEKDLSDTLKLVAKQTYSEDPYLYKKNSLKSQLIHLESISPKTYTKVRTIY